MVSQSMLKVLHLGLQLNDWVDTTQCVRHYPPPLKILHFVCLYKSPKLFRFLPLECKDGYFGSKCEKLCRYPNYGKLCQFHCNCTEEDCDHISGCQGTKRRLFSGIFFLENTYWVNRRLVNDFNWDCFPLLNANMIQAFINTCLFTVPTLHAIYTASSFIMYRFCSWNALHD